MKNEIKQLIAQNNTEKAISKLLFLAKGQNSNDLLLLQSKYNKLKRENRLYLVSRNELSIEYNQLNQSLLEITDEVFKETSLGTIESQDSKMKEKNKPENLDNPPMGKFWKILVALGLILAIPEATSQFTGYSLRDFISCNKPQEIASNTVSVFVKSRYGITLPLKGKVYLRYGNAQIGKEINNNNEAIFTEVPEGYFNEGNKVKVTFTDPEGEPYYAIFEDSIYQLIPNQSIELVVGLKGLDKLNGIVKDFKTGDFIQGARVSVLNLEVYTNEFGWWELSIKDSKYQKKFHTLRVSKEGYDNWEQANIPAQIDKEIAILLKPK